MKVVFLNAQVPCSAGCKNMVFFISTFFVPHTRNKKARACVCVIIARVLALHIKASVVLSAEIDTSGYIVGIGIRKLIQKLVQVTPVGKYTLEQKYLAALNGYYDFQGEEIFFG